MVIKLFMFVDELLSTQSSRTIIQTFVNLFRSSDITDMASFGLAKEFYFVLASTLQLQYGNILLATASKSEIQSVIDNDWPFFTNSTDLVKACLEDLGCDKLQEFIQNLGITLFIDFSSRYHSKLKTLQMTKVSHKCCPFTQST